MEQMNDGAYYIGICDDFQTALDELSSIIADIGIRLELKFIIRCFRDGEELLTAAEMLDAVFLDIEMPGMDGIETGNQIRKVNPRCKIIMASGYIDRFKEVFFIGAFRFITKPYREEEIYEALTSAIISLPGQEMIDLFYNRREYSLCQRDISYVRAINGYTEYCVNNRLYRKDITIQEAEEVLTKELFVRVSRQKLVNLRYVRKVAVNTYLCGNIEITVSRRQRKQFEQRYIEYDLTYGRKL